MPVAKHPPYSYEKLAPTRPSIGNNMLFDLNIGRLIGSLSPILRIPLLMVIQTNRLRVSRLHSFSLFQGSLRRMFTAGLTFRPIR